MTAAERRVSLPAVPFLLMPLAFLAAACTVEPDAATQLTPAATVRPASNQTHLSLGKQLLAAREPELAMRAFMASVSFDGISAEAMTGAGIAARQQGLATESRRFLEQAVTLAPDSSAAQFNLGVVLFQLNEYHGARNAFRSAFALSSGTSELAAQRLNRTEEIIALLERKPELDPTISHDVVRLGGGQFRLVDAEPAETEVLGE